MPNQNPLAIGDLPYPQISETQPQFIKQSLAIVKGNIYTLDASGRLIVPISTSGVADLTGGIFQAKADAPAPTAEDTDTVQVTTSRSRILLKADVDNMIPGSEVELKSSSSTTTADTAMVAVQPHTKGYIGRIFEIYTKNTNGTPKQKSTAGDLLVIDVEVA